MNRRGGRGVVQASDSCMGSLPSLLKTQFLSPISGARVRPFLHHVLLATFTTCPLVLPFPLSGSRYSRIQLSSSIMAAGQSAVSFNEIIQAGTVPPYNNRTTAFSNWFFLAKHCRTCLGRQKKKNEELASQILGKNRRASAPGPGAAGKAKNATPGSLASRIGVTKVTSLGSILVPSTVAKEKNDCSDWVCFVV